MAYEQNTEITITPISDLVKENSFIGKIPESTPLPTFEEVKDRLPKPVWDGHPEHINCYWRAWQLAFQNLKHPAPETGFAANYIDTAFNGCTFMWDSVFMLMFGKYADRLFKFQETLDNFYAKQHRDGFICREIEEDTGKDRFTRHDPSATGPDVMAWCEWEYYLNFGDKERLSKVFAPLMAYHRWMAEHHTWPDGTYFSSGWGCGMDNTPRLMKGYDTSFGHGHMIWVDACMQEILSCNSLINIAAELGRTEFIEELSQERDHLQKVVNEKLWDESTGFYYDLWRTGEHNMVRHIGCYWALLSQCAPQERADRMMAYLQDKNEFRSPHRVPSLTKSHPAYSETGTYWRGSVWAPTNYMVLKGLVKYERYDLSYEIAAEHLQAVVDVYKDSDTLFENYTPERIDGKFMKGTPARKDFVGWSGLSPISVFFEFVLGIKPDAVNKTILWCVNLLERHGIENYPFGADGELTLLCEKRNSVNERPVITLRSNVPVEVKVLWGDEEHRQTMTIRA